MLDKYIQFFSANFDPEYAVFLAAYYDTLQESFCTEIPADFIKMIEYYKDKARADHDGQGISAMVAGEDMQIWSSGSRGHRWVLENDDFQVHIRTDDAGWNINVRYISAGLWEYGVDKMRERVHRFIWGIAKPIHGEGKSHGLSRLDFCFDFYAPKFTNEFGASLINSFVMKSGITGSYFFDSMRGQTITIGISKKPNVQICIYDKGKEMRDKNHKAWMYEIYEKEGYYPSDADKGHHIWRVEIRLFKKYLYNRNINQFEDIRDRIHSVILDAMFDRRLVRGNARGAHRERLKAHPLYAAIYDQLCLQEYVYTPIGRKTTMRRSDYIEFLKKMQAGVSRSLTVAKDGDWNKQSAFETARDTVLLAEDDEKHDKKTQKCIEKMAFIDEAH